jgi:hypothetical protein
MTNCLYEVLSPWAEADPIPLRGISPRVTSLEGKKIGLYRNEKLAAEPIMNAVEERLKGRLPTAEFRPFVNPQKNEWIIEQDLKAEFEEWVKGVDAVVTAFGD